MNATVQCMCSFAYLSIDRCYNSLAKCGCPDCQQQNFMCAGGAEITPESDEQNTKFPMCGVGWGWQCRWFRIVTGVWHCHLTVNCWRFPYIFFKRYFSSILDTWYVYLPFKRIYLKCQRKGVEKGEDDQVTETFSAGETGSTRSWHRTGPLIELRCCWVVR